MSEKTLSLNVIPENLETDAILAAAEFVGILPNEADALISYYKGYKRQHQAEQPSGYSVVDRRVIQKAINEAMMKHCKFRRCDNEYYFEKKDWWNLIDDAMARIPYQQEPEQQREISVVDEAEIKRHIAGAAFGFCLDDTDDHMKIADEALKRIRRYLRAPMPVSFEDIFEKAISESWNSTKELVRNTLKVAGVKYHEY